VLRWERGNDTDLGIGKPLAEALPELRGDEMMPLLDELFTTGEGYEDRAGRADLVVNGVLGTYYFDYSFRPLRDAAGAVYAIMETAVDVIQQVIAHPILEVEHLPTVLGSSSQLGQLFQNLLSTP
jgi:hypothetical protein